MKKIIKNEQELIKIIKKYQYKRLFYVAFSIILTTAVLFWLTNGNPIFISIGLVIFSISFRFIELDEDNISIFSLQKILGLKIDENISVVFDKDFYCKVKCFIQFSHKKESYIFDYRRFHDEYQDGLKALEIDNKKHKQIKLIQ